MATCRPLPEDSTILAGLLAQAPDKADFKILPDLLSKEEIGVGVKKGETALLKAVNDELVNWRKTAGRQKSMTSGSVRCSPAPQPRNFKIEAR